MNVMHAALCGGLLVAAGGCHTGEPMFNGRDLSGWTEIASRGAWTVQDGVLRCDGSRDGYAWLCSDSTCRDFELTCRWRIPEGANAGIFLRAPGHQGRISMLGMEVQIKDDRKDPDLSDVSGAVFRRIPASGRYARPIGQWNDFRILCRGRRLRIELNGRLVSDTDIDTVPAQGDDPPMSRVPDEGYIGLQNHGTPVEFRDIRIRVLLREAP